MSTLSVSEIFGPTLQGEGPEMGRRVLFLRLAGCDYRCAWCDTPYALRRQDGKMMSISEILSEFMERTVPGAPTHVVVSGGNPFLQRRVMDLLVRSPLGWVYHAETQGTLWQKWANHMRVHHIAISPKLRNAGVDQDPRTVAEFIAQTREPWARVSLKMVVFNADDIQEALDNYWEFAPKVRDWILQVGTYPGEPLWGTLNRWKQLANDVTTKVDKPVKLLPQSHVLLWGSTKGV